MSHCTPPSGSPTLHSVPMRISTLAQRMRMPTRYPTLRLNLSLSELTAHRPQREHGTMITHCSLARSGRCHVSSWVAPKTWNVTPSRPARFSCRPHARRLPASVHPMHVNASHPTASKGALVFTHSRWRRCRVPVCHAPARHPYPLLHSLPFLVLQGVGSCSVSQAKTCHRS